MKKLLRQASKARLILVPKGDDSRPCLQAFTNATGIAVPEFAGRELEAGDGTRIFLKVKGRDIPRFIAAGYGDIGLTGSDSCADYATSPACPVTYERFGPPMCRFVLLAPATRAAEVRRRLKIARKPLEAATSFPDLLRERAAQLGLNLRPCDLPVRGSVEIMPRLLGVPLVADLVASGRTAEANGLVEVATLLDVYPAVVVRTPGTSPRPAEFSYGDIERIDAVLADRSRRSTRRAASYTASLMRDTNAAGKKAGEEFGEVMMAIAGDAAVTDCENEIADLTYAQLVAAYSRGKPAKLSSVLGILVDRNRQRGET